MIHILTLLCQIIVILAWSGYPAPWKAISNPSMADDLNDLHQKVRDAVNCHFEPADKPKMIRLHFVHEEVIAV